MKSILRRAMPARVRRIAAVAGCRLIELAGRAVGRGDELMPPQALMFVGSGDFQSVGNQFLGHFRRLGHLQPHHHVLDVGCGIGRMAIPLTGFLSGTGSYEGFDVVPHGITWCARRITPRFPRFRFRLVSVRNHDYNPRGKVTASMFRFPYPDASYDFVCLTSVFTHMLPADIGNYMREIARVLKPGGVSFITWFLLNDVSRALIADGQSGIDFSHVLEDGLTMDERVPERAIAFDERRVREWYGINGLALDGQPHYGSWCGRTVHLDFQDIVVARKSGAMQPIQR